MEIIESRLTSRATMKRVLLVLNCILLTIGNCVGPLILRLYFIQGGKRVWFSTWLQTAGWPIFFIPLTIAYFRRWRQRQRSQENNLFLMKPRLFFAFIIIGILIGFDDYLYAYGLARLPVSTSSLIVATQLGFTAAFAFLVVKQKFTSFSTNAVVLLTIGAAVLALHTSGDRPDKESNKEYILGFVMTLVSSALAGLILPLVELAYKKAKQQITYDLVLEVQMVMGIFATVVCTVGMLVNNDFQAISKESKEFELGETKYYLVVVFSAITCQCFFLGVIGVIFCASSLLSGIIIAVGLPVTELLAVIFYKENFQPEKGVALALSLWGFISYFYGEIKDTKKQKETTTLENRDATTTCLS